MMVACYLGQSSAPPPAPSLPPGFLIAAAVTRFSRAVVVIAALIRRKSTALASEAACGQCGYIVKGLATFTCPECGSYLREVLESNDVFGKAVNVASRVQQLAFACESLFTEATFAMINEVASENAGTFELKGVRGAVRAYRAVFALESKTMPVEADP